MRSSARATFASALALAAALSPAVAAAQNMPTIAVPGVRTVTVGGQGLVSRPPDTVVISVRVTTTGKSPAIADATNEDAFTALRSRIAAISSADTVTSVALHPAAPAAPATGEAGSMTTRDVTVKAAVADNARVNAAIAAPGVRANGTPRYELDDKRGAYLEALTEAMADARASAEKLASVGGFGLGRIQSVNAAPLFGAGLFQDVVQQLMSRFSGAAGSDATTPVEVRASVTVTYEIK